MVFTKKVFYKAQYVIDQMKNKTTVLATLNTFLLIFDFLYIFFRFKYINSEIPFYYTRLWGDYQLAPKSYIYIIPMVSFVVFLVGYLMIALNKIYLRFFDNIIWFCITFSNVFLSHAVIRIIKIASTPFEPLINPLYLNLIPPFLVGFLAIYFILPFFIDLAFRERLVTNPTVHTHPAMILKNPAARGGGFVYGMVFLLVSLIYVGFYPKFNGLYLSVFMISILGLIDDYQNTHPSSSFKMFENPALRLFLLFMSIIPTLLSGALITSSINPLGGVLNFDIYSVKIGSEIVPVLSGLITSLWIVWIMNILSWSNGIDGQYAGIVGFASLIVALLAFRFPELEASHYKIAYLAAISAGVAFGFTKYTWHPSKVMWGFGAMSAGLVISSLSIMSQSKILTSVLVILIPFLDALVTVIRRLLQRKNPMSGDRGHLHHLLLDRGWSVSSIAVFYWITTGVFGLIGLFTPEKLALQAGLIVAGVVAFFIILLNVKSANGNGKKISQIA